MSLMNDVIAGALGGIAGAAGMSGMMMIRQKTGKVETPLPLKIEREPGWPDEPMRWRTECWPRAAIL